MLDAVGGQLAGRRILVTGAGTGIGQGIALACGRAGAAVVLHYAHNREGADTVVAQLAEFGGRAWAVEADLRDVSECRRLVARADEWLGGLDGLVNNAAVTIESPFLETNESEYDTMATLNLRGYFYCSQAAARIFVEQGSGVILNVTSAQALVAVDHHAAYAATKGGIVSLTRELSLELSPNVRVNAIGPGLIEVPRIVDRADGDGIGYDRNRAAQAVPLRRVGSPADVAGAAVFLLSDLAGYITGQTLYVDGGITAQVPAVL